MFEKKYKIDAIVIDLPEDTFVSLKRNYFTNRWSATVAAPDKKDPTRVSFHRADEGEIGYALQELQNRGIQRSILV